LIKIFHRTNPFLPLHSTWRCRLLCFTTVKGVAPLPRWQRRAQQRMCRAMHHGAALQPATPLSMAHATRNIFAPSTKS
jgi:hypothetical protein